MNELVIQRNHIGFSVEGIERSSCSFECNEYLSIDPKKLHDIPYPLPQIAIKKTGDNRMVDELQIALINGSWDTSDKIPSIVAEVKNTCGSLQSNSCLDNNPIKNVENSDNDGDFGNKNLSWLFDFKFNELPPIPGMAE
ncbi:hypothetical protein HHI36_015637 [Cryptolaemus montrouzieri]|uniref:Uncharacterized protein n=1 Tax=Cryptolaemus montrouzieri TaxID=559131 RepID=A0ABD2N7N7_9CUCU